MDTLPCPIPRHVGIVAKKSSAEATETAGYVERFLRGKGLDVLRDEEAIAKGAELVVVLGGDGTLIHASRVVAGRAVPILGINMGSLGFMTEVPQSELYPALESVLAGKGTVSQRRKLRVHLHRGGKDGPPELDGEVLNDAVIAKGALSPMVELDTSFGGAYVTTYRADGVIVATPTGSTAYSLAANGPILFPTMSGVVIAPICPHTLTQRPIVVPDDQTINIVLLNEVPAFLSMDGQTGVSLGRGDRVQVKQSPGRVLLVRNPKLDFFGILRAKLRWGER
jgi:NAD+ kinase